MTRFPKTVVALDTDSTLVTAAISGKLRDESFGVGHAAHIECQSDYGSILEQNSFDVSARIGYDRRHITQKPGPIFGL